MKEDTMSTERELRSALAHLDEATVEARVLADAITELCELRAECERYKAALAIAVTAIRDVHHDIAGQAQMCVAMEKIAALATSSCRSGSLDMRQICA